jgi:uncharacterized protein (DUF427 family)
MTITVGSGPFGHRPSGEFNVEMPQRGLEYLDAFPRRVRAIRAGEVVVDSLGTKLLYEQHRLPVWVFPREDVRLDVLGSAARLYEDGLAEGLVHVEWGAVDQWLEEDEEVIVHPRDPYHRLELRHTSRRVKVSLEGEVLAETTRAIALFEASLPPRWYFPLEDVRAELAPNSEIRTGCAYKGYADYYDVRVAGRVEPLLAWHYEDPLSGMERIRGLVCFFNERVDVGLDGVLQERPQSQWSGTDWAKSEWARHGPHAPETAQTTAQVD